MANRCAIRTAAQCTNRSEADIATLLTKYGSDDLKSDMKHFKQLTSEVFSIVGVCLGARFDLFLYLSATTRCALWSEGVLDGSATSVYEVRYDIGGHTYQTLAQCPRNPLFLGNGHWSCVGESRGPVTTVDMPTRWRGGIF